MDYQTIQAISGTIGLLIFVSLFVGILIYALRPKNKAKFDHAARLPLDPGRVLPTHVVAALVWRA